MSKRALTKQLRLPKPLVITVGNLKGGASKTTTSFFLACYFATKHNLKVLVVDADPLSQTAYSWYDTLARGGVEVPFDLIAFPSKQVGTEIDRRSGEYDVVIVDAGGESDEIFKAAVKKSQELIIATSTARAELRRIPATYESAAFAASQVTHEINVRVLLTRVPNVMRKVDGDKVNISTEYRQARAWLDEADYFVFENYITAAQWYRLATDGDLGEGAENPIIDIGEYGPVGDELVSYYMEDA